MTIAYRLPGNQMTINIDGAMLRAADDGFFRVDSGSRAEAVLLAGGAQLAPAGAIPGDSSDVGLTLPEVLAARGSVSQFLGINSGLALVGSSTFDRDCTPASFLYQPVTFSDAWVETLRQECGCDDPRLIQQYRNRSEYFSIGCFVKGPFRGYQTKNADS